MSRAETLLSAVKAGRLEEFKTLLQADPALARARGDDGVSAVMLAVYYGRQDFVRELLVRGLELNIWEASAVGDAARLNEILDQSPDLLNAFSPDGYLSIGLAVFFGHPAVVESLLARGAEVNVPSQNAAKVCPLHSAVAQSDPAVALALTQRLLEKGANPNARQSGGWTPLHEAARRGHAEMVTALLGAGAEAAARSDDGTTALDLARAGGHVEVVRLLE